MSAEAPTRLHRMVGALLVKEGRLLLGLRSATRDFCPGVWDVLGGHVEPGEQLEACLARELQEELGVTPTRWRHLETMVEAGPGPGEAVECHFYLVESWQGEPRNLQSEEHDAIGWHAPEQAALLALAHPSYPALFARALAGA